MVDDSVREAVARAEAEYDDIMQNGILLKSGVRINDPEVLAEFEKQCSREEWVHNTAEMYLDQKVHPENYDADGYPIEVESEEHSVVEEQTEDPEEHYEEEESVYETPSRWRTTIPQKIGFVVGVILWFITPLIVAIIYSFIWLFVWLNHDWDTDEESSGGGYYEGDHASSYESNKRTWFGRSKSSYNFHLNNNKPRFSLIGISRRRKSIGNLTSTWTYHRNGGKRTFTQSFKSINGSLTYKKEPGKSEVKIIRRGRYKLTGKPNRKHW